MVHLGQRGQAAWQVGGGRDDGARREDECQVAQLLLDGQLWRPTRRVSKRQPLRLQQQANQVLQGEATGGECPPSQRRNTCSLPTTQALCRRPRPS